MNCSNPTRQASSSSCNSLCNSRGCGLLVGACGGLAGFGSRVQGVGDVWPFCGSKLPWAYRL